MTAAVCTLRMTGIGTVDHWPVAGADSESAFCGFPERVVLAMSGEKDKVDTTTEVIDSELKKAEIKKGRCECKIHGGFYQSG